MCIYIYICIHTHTYKGASRRRRAGRDWRAGRAVLLVDLDGKDGVRPGV